MILLIVGIGAQAANSEGNGKIAKILMVAGVSAYIFALGAQGPTADIFRFLFENMPGFRIMREPQKFDALVALAYAGLFGIGVHALGKALTQRRMHAVVALVILAVPCAYTFRMFWGFGGYARPSNVPTSWTEAAALMGTGPEKVLALPGDQYLAFPWTQQRAVASPMGSFFDRDVIIDGRLGLGGLESQTADARSRYLRFITDHGSRTMHMGNLIAPLGVRYVMLVKTGDWASYSWLEEQTDLQVIRSWPDLELFENLEPVSPIYAPERLVTVRDWGEVVGLARRMRLTDLAIPVRDPQPGPIRVPDIAIPSGVTEPLTPQRTGPVGFDIASPGDGWIAFTQPFDPAWRLDGKPPLANLGVTNLFEAPPTRTVAEVRYSRWPLVRLSYALSATFVLASLVLAIDARRRRSKLDPQDTTSSRPVASIPVQPTQGFAEPLA